MASAFSHTFVALALGKTFQHPIMAWPVLLSGSVYSIVPDLDVIGFTSLQYGGLWGHRGMTHFLLFAGLLSVALVSIGYTQMTRAVQMGIFVYLFLCAASHGVLDALADDGFGVAFFSTFDTCRYFFSARPVAVSPFGITALFAKMLRALAGKVKWAWLAPCRILHRSCTTQCAEKQAPSE